MQPLSWKLSEAFFASNAQPRETFRLNKQHYSKPLTFLANVASLRATALPAPLAQKLQAVPIRRLRRCSIAIIAAIDPPGLRNRILGSD